jgi:predicted nucleotidyltransferase
MPELPQTHLHLRPEDRATLLALLNQFLPNEEIWAYGSRVNGTGHETSDLDLVVRHPADLRQRQGPALNALKEALSESTIPLLVDLHDWATLPPLFWENILEGYVVVKGSSEQNRAD